MKCPFLLSVTFFFFFFSLDVLLCCFQQAGTDVWYLKKRGFIGPHPQHWEDERQNRRLASKPLHIVFSAVRIMKQNERERRRWDTVERTFEEPTLFLLLLIQPAVQASVVSDSRSCPFRPHFPAVSLLSQKLLLNHFILFSLNSLYVCVFHIYCTRESVELIVSELQKCKREQYTMNI